jgi:hypothetical protein
MSPEGSAKSKEEVKAAVNEALKEKDDTKSK